MPSRKNQKGAREVRKAFNRDVMALLLAIANELKRQGEEQRKQGELLLKISTDAEVAAIPSVRQIHSEMAARRAEHA